MLETVFLIAICCQLGDKRQLKILFLTIFDLRSSIVLMFLIAAYPVYLLIYCRLSQDNLKHGLGVIKSFHVSVEKIILFRCMFHDAMVDISAYN